MRLNKTCFLLLLLLLLGFSSAFAQEVSLFVGGEKKGSVSILLSDGITYISPEELARQLGGSFRYTPENGSFSFTLEKKLFQLQVNNPTALVDGKIKLLDYFPKVVGNKIYIPLNFVLENTSVKFDPKKSILYVGEAPSLLPAEGMKPTTALPGKAEGGAASTTLPSTATPIAILPSQADSSILLSNVRYYSATNYTRIVIDLSKVPDYKVTVEGGYIVVNLRSTRVSKEETYKIRDGLVKDVEVLSGDDHSKVRIGVEGIPLYRDFTLEQPPRVVIDVLRRGQPSIPSVVSPPSVSGEQKPLVQGAMPQKEETQVRGKGRFLVVLDPGHGGEDAGAIGAMGTKEKDVTLSVSFLVRDELVKRGYRVALTRDRDITIPLEERARIANRLKADAFISIHCNAAFSPSASGSEVYYMALPTDSSAMAVALRENMELGLDKEEVKKRTDVLVRILEDMMKNAKINDSAKLAESIYGAMRGRLEIPVRRIAQAPFFVLRGAMMPAVLIEVAFISNPREERLLRDASWQRKVATLIADGINRYLSSIR